jgi:hypothetical protein
MNGPEKMLRLRSGVSGERNWTGMKSGPSPAAQTVFYLREENGRLFEENRQLREQNANLKRQIENWRKLAAEPEGFIRCATCRRSKPVTEFWRDRSRLRGYRSYCKSCDRMRYGIR